MVLNLECIVERIVQNQYHLNDQLPIESKLDHRCSPLEQIPNEVCYNSLRTSIEHPPVTPVEYRQHVSLQQGQDTEQQTAKVVDFAQSMQQMTCSVAEEDSLSLVQYLLHNLRHLHTEGKDIYVVIHLKIDSIPEHQQELNVQSRLKLHLYRRKEKRVIKKL